MTVLQATMRILLSRAQPLSVGERRIDTSKRAKDTLLPLLHTRVNAHANVTNACVGSLG